jgi:hypothetical protein
MLGKLFDAVFGCWHTHYTFPMSERSSSRRGKAVPLTGTYVVCLDCGRDFSYDWEGMRVLSPRSEKTRSAGSLVTKGKA